MTHKLDCFSAQIVDCWTKASIVLMKNDLTTLVGLPYFPENFGKTNRGLHSELTVLRFAKIYP